MTCLPTIVETVAETLKLPYAAVTLAIGDQQRLVAGYGLPRGEVVELPLNYQGDSIGRLVCGLRAPNEPFTAGEMTLLQDLGHQAGVVLHAVRLTEELRKSREQLVLAREEERRRLRRDLHDGLGPELASMTLKLDAARNLMARNPDGADQLLLEMKAQVQDSLSNVRRLVYGLRPPALDELGLVPAVRESSAVRSAGSRPQISVVGPDPFPPLPAAVEVAAYRVALEAVTNVVRHASAETCRIEFNVSDELELEVVDDGCGMAPRSRAGVGLTSMRERAFELGGSLSIGPGPRGGTRLKARFPSTLKESLSMNPVRLLVVDDHTLFRDGLRALFGSIDDIDVVGEASDGDQAVAQAAELHPDIVLMDIQIPKVNGIEATRRIVSAQPEIGVIVVTMLEDNDSVFAAMRAGARGYILKGADQHEMLRAIRSVAAGEALFGADVADRVMSFFNDAGQPQRRTPPSRI